MNKEVENQNVQERIDNVTPENTADTNSMNEACECCDFADEDIVVLENADMKKIKAKWALIGAAVASAVYLIGDAVINTVRAKREDDDEDFDEETPLD